jgi:hypothetical protein
MMPISVPLTITRSLVAITLSSPAFTVVPSNEKLPVPLTPPAALAMIKVPVVPKLALSASVTVTAVLAACRA